VCKNFAARTMAVIHIRDLLNCFGTILTTPRIVSALLGRGGLYLVVQLQGRAVRLIREVYYFHGLCLHSGSMWSWNSLCLLTWNVNIVVSTRY
jgi:hypothetical protein